jgi:protoheme IX farnesyltransferase
MSSWISLVIILIANVFMIWLSVLLYMQMEKKAARRVMFASYIYLPVVLLALLADKI